MKKTRSKILLVYLAIIAFVVMVPICIKIGMGTFGAVIFVILALISFYIVGRKFKKSVAPKESTFGKARFSEKNEVVRTGLTGNGIVFGKIDKKLITKPETVEGHVLVVGGTGTGKSRGVVIPSLLIWKGSALVMDIKGEISDKTSQARREDGNAVYVFNPEKPEGACYDPIRLCNTVDSAQEFARSLIPLPKQGDTFWAEAAQGILSAYAFEGARNGEKLCDIAEMLCVSKIDELVSHCRESDIREVRLLCSVAYDLPDKTLGGVIGELKSKLITIASDENIRKATDKSDWSPETLESGATIYLRVSEKMIEQYKPLWQVIISQVFRYLSGRQEGKEPPVLIALDELPRLGKVGGLISALSTLRSKNVHILGIIQSMAQLDAVYGKDERKIIADNCRFKLVLSATDPETQKYFSNLAGQKTVMAEGYSSGRGVNITGHQQGAPLIRPEEFSNLDKPILFAPKLQPTKVDFAFWDKESLKSMC